MKVIDLLNLIYENKAPKKIKYGGRIYIYSDFRYKTEDDYSSLDEFNLFHPGIINDEIEIIEEKPKKIEHIKKNQNRNDKINEIIDSVNYLLEKSKDDEV